MPIPIRLFISGGPEQEPARELLGQGLAAFPVNAGWVIKRTPNIDAVAESHLYLLLMGPDIVAPVGLELWWARRTKKPIFAYRLDQARTPAGQVFIQENADLDWRRGADLLALQRAVLADLARYLLAYAERYGITVAEIQRLHHYIAELERAAEAARQVRPDGGTKSRTLKETFAGKLTGAAGGGVILAPGKDEPVGARVVGG